MELKILRDVCAGLWGYLRLAAMWGKASSIPITCLDLGRDMYPYLYAYKCESFKK